MIRVSTAVMVIAVKIDFVRISGSVPRSLALEDPEWAAPTNHHYRRK